MTTTQRAVFRQRSQIVTTEDWIMRVLLILGTLWLLVGVVLPLYPMMARSFQDSSGRWVGFANYIQYLTTPALAASFFNSLYIAIASTIIAVMLAFIYAYALTRTAMRGKNIFRILGMLPLYIPPLAHAIGLIYLFGNQGVVTTGLFGLLPGWNIGLYGANGIIIGEVLYCFPQALVILITALSLTDARLYEASEVLGSSPTRTFLTVTLPGIKYGLMSAIFVCFTLAFTDFGVPKVVGGNFNVLATDIYKQVIGQQNFAMGATISVFLLIPTVVAFIINQIVQRRQTAAVSAKAVPLQPKPNPSLDGMMFGFCTLTAGFAVIVLLTIVFASLIQVWPYNFTLGFKHYNFSTVGGGGYGAYWNSIQMSFYTAVVGTIAVFISAYLVEKGKGFKWLRGVNYFLSTIPLALPGLVLGLAYVFFFNNPYWEIPFIQNYLLVNPFNWLYGTMGILVLCNIIHFYTVCFLTANTALKQIDPEFEAVSAAMSVPFYQTFWRVTVPLSLPAILEIGIYYFVNAMITISAIIFLYPPTLPVAAVAIVNMDDAGDTAAAAAMSALIVFTSIGIRILYWFLTQGLQKRTQAWLQR
ncbi:putative 2-aminoethylphosphonate ABC transporter permease subunit [Chroococcidiopsis sp. FACHB-1243]|uniref:putative 2-aminoethylphosphonate ABC transporter permease subunit n=1 Tax=Chroococcidiopsis sp. [FACHB-1243] TaxID=2692781 RepID=UPI00177C42C3|nr:putative 2-aminoethylphosphonate ABC transporter permease subunit [Chroococcidiopsis sp. [FACHB-1243]]MBD2304465.1 putative 2-aminoethylphosphonate ABC transporter permease subunit [Chroococcidiopsis sp. [FACHB-1243]]